MKVIKNCKICDKVFTGYEYPDAMLKYCSRICVYKSQLGKLPWNIGLDIKDRIPKDELERRHEQFSGINNPKWNGGRYKERGFQYQLILSRSHWRKNRRIALKRDNYICKQCKRNDITMVVHHIIPYKICQSHEINNLVTLCRSCHDKIERHGYKCLF